VAETEEKSNSIPWLLLITLIGVSSGVFFFFPQLISSRPGGGESQLAGNTFDYQTIAARLWQDPLGVAIADREKNTDQESKEKFQKYCAVHCVAEFQKLVIEKCYAKLPNYRLDDDSGFSEEQAKQIRILAVMIPGGPYVEDVERRLRSRRAVIEGLASEGYVPEKDDEIGYFEVPWQPLEPNVTASVRMLEKKRLEDEKCSSPTEPGIQPSRSNRDGSNAAGLTVPYEWFAPEGDEKPVEHVLVLWLMDNSFSDAPLARLADFISWFRLKTVDRFDADDFLPPVFEVLGPDNSGTLHTMVMEAAEDPWSAEMRQCLATTHIYSCQASAAEFQLLSGIRGPDGTPIHFARGCTCKDLIERSVNGQQSDNGFYFDRAILPDDVIVKTMWQELENRGVKNNDRVAIISEEDTFYARALSSTFINSSPKGSRRENLSLYTYLRGIDGKLPSDGKYGRENKGAAESTDKDTRSVSRPTDQPEGLNQADGIRRLAKQLQELNAKAERDSGGKASLKAVGLLGSDVYDKLELLKALHSVLPEAVFFTNNLDARLFYPDEWNETHNLVVVSPFRLSPPSNLPHSSIQFSDFRDSAQTALFEATREAMGQRNAVGVPSIPQSPVIFEIGRNGPKELTIPADKVDTLAKLYASEADNLLIKILTKLGLLKHRSGSVEPPNLFQCYLLHISAFIGSGILLLAWTRSVSRVARAPSKQRPNAMESIGKK
jgi:hypothetical protein